MEAPVTFGDRLKDWNRVFNWTMVHRRDSDIFAPYGSFARRTSKYDTHVPPFVWTSKEKMAAWFVSNCDAQSRRQEYVRLLQRDVHVDIYGSCGNMTCPKSSSSNCLYQLHKKYRYYLAFENSLCEDYITEKAMGIYQEGIDVIPVVRGSGDRYSMFLPPNSYISTQDFSIEKLAETMESLTNSEEEFEKYFAWRQYYYAEETDLRFCDLCKKLHNAYKLEQLYESITDWLVDHPDHRNCKEPTDIDDELPD
ncbi:alpha-(1,3)-fucosyltransferase C-like [Ylistrum balloti]|uniref:alpha-(1,3)-fucosyltransferase C-like n=1 Tax=Ylistrum balloti TaxID=509963 RepID=UPI002905AEDD|nr:alpha-(1,3)-fucosyltransferase C-like [Ylistrum balloti]